MLKVDHYSGNCRWVWYECDKCGERIKVHIQESMPTACPYCMEPSTEAKDVPVIDNDTNS